MQDSTERKWIRMKQFLPREKMSKREKRALDAAKRTSWDGVNPATRKVESKKTYDRKRSPRWYDDDSTGIFHSPAVVLPSTFCSSGSL